MDALMQKTIGLLIEQLSGIHSGILSAGLVETVKVDCYGQATPIKHMASVVQQGRRITINPYDPGMIGALERALKKCGFSAYKFSKQAVVINAPDMSGEELEKTFARISRLGEDAKIAVRNIRKNHRNKLSDDEKKEQDKKLNEETHAAVERIDTIISGKIELLRG